MVLTLIRHGRPLVDPATPAAGWSLDPAGYDDVWALRRSGRVPGRAAWYSSPEPKAQETSALLTDGEVGIVDALAEHRRGGSWVEDFPSAVRRAVASPERAAVEGWETIAECRARVVGAVRLLIDQHAGDDLVLVGHGTAWTLVVADLTGRPPDLDRWSRMALPDLIVVQV